jgi:four helix bundle protein
MAALRAAARTFQDLLVWRKAHQLVLAVYSFTAAFPKEETYGLALQMRRAAVSIPANIAEGFRRRGKADKARYMNLAEASLEESRYYLILAHDLGYGDTSNSQLHWKKSAVCSTPTRLLFGLLAPEF